MKAREHNSPIIQELIDETTSEELEKINKEMTKTAVEWLIDEHFGGIDNCTPDFRFHIQQAKEMDKQQKMDAFNQGYRDGEVDASNPTNMSKDVSEFSNAENYYKLTYGGNK
jgi:hypothetical protein